MTTADVWEVIASAFVGALQAAGVFGPLIKLGVVPLTDPLFVGLFSLRQGLDLRVVLLNGADAHLFQRRMIQLASIVLSHLPSESDEIRPVNKNVQLLMD